MVAISVATKSTQPIHYKPIKMMFNMSAKAITLMLAAGVATTTAGSNLRQGERRASIFHHGSSNKAAETTTSSNLRAPAPAEQPAAAVESSANLEPSLTLSKPIYTEDESITVNFSVGSPYHAYYSSPSAPSKRVDTNYPQWSIGLFMRDADPQGGTLAPIVSINICGALGKDCDANNRDYASYQELSVTFGSEFLDVMQGTWPLEVSRYGTGFDAYVLDGRGAAAIGPLEFYISQDEEEVDTAHSYRKNGGAVYKPSVSNNEESSEQPAAPAHKSTNPLLKYHKGTKKSTERTHATVAKAKAAAQNSKIINANGLEMSSNAIPSSPSIHKVASTPEETSTKTEGSLTSNKSEYEDDESVSINFSFTPTSEEVDLSNYKIGIFMRMAHPQGGSLDPVVSLPLCSSTTAASCDGTGSVTFGSETMDQMTGSQWPMDLYEWGTGFDAYVLDESGDDVLGPVKFNILMNDTY
jgi:hypothetical protein